MVIKSCPKSCTFHCNLHSRFNKKCTMKYLLHKITVLLTLILVMIQVQSVQAQSLIDITGTVLNEKGDPLKGVSVSTQNKGVKDRTVTTNEKGIYTLKQITAGVKFNVKFSHIGYTDVEQIFSVTKSSVCASLMAA